MPKQKFKRLCKKCGKFYLPDGTRISSFGYCEKCRVIPGRCKFITDSGYQCHNESEVFGYCMSHFLEVPMKKLREEARKL